MPDAALNHFPNVDAFDDTTFAKLRYLPRWLSVFDHWLREEEAAASKIMTYDLATERGASAEYLAGEQKLLAFYGQLFADGAIRLMASHCEDAHHAVAHHGVFDPALAEAVVTSLRERKAGDLMDCYVPHRSLRVMGGYDRTDLLLFQDAAAVDDVEQLARNCGLFLLA